MNLKIYIGTKKCFMNEAQCCFGSHWHGLNVRTKTIKTFVKISSLMFQERKCWQNVHSRVDYPFNQFARSFAGASSILAASSAVIRMVFGWLEKCFRMWELKLWWRGRKSKLFGKNFNTASVEEWNEKGMMFDCSHIELHNVHHDASLAQFENLTRIICHNDTHRTTFISRIPKKKSTSLVLILICNSMLQRINACLHHWDIMTA